MERLIYKEEQSFRQSFIPWIFLAVGVFMIVGFSIGFYQQLYLGKPYGDEPMSNKGLIWSSIVSFVAISTTFIFILSAKLTTEIWSDGIRCKFPPLVSKFRNIPISDISSAVVEKYRPIVEFGGWGWRRRMLRRKTAYDLKGRIGIRVLKQDGRMILFGTHLEEEMKRPVKTLMQPDTNKYSI